MSESAVIVDSEVWLNDCKSHAKLSPYICRHGFWLRNHFGNTGPHTEINLLPDRFAEIMSTDHEGEINAKLEGNNIGHIDKNTKWREEGNVWRRPIQQCALSIARVPNSTKFTFTGKTGYVDPNSVDNGRKIDLAGYGIYKFTIWFLIQDLELDTFFKDEIALRAMRDYVSRNLSD